MKKFITLGAAVLVTAMSFAQEAISIFEKPYREIADGEILNVNEVGHSSPFIYDFNKDGKDDLLVGFFGSERAEWDTLRKGHALTQGGCQIYLNKGSNEKPEYTYAGNLMAGGKMAYVPTDCCNGFTPRIVDLDGDGIDDVISGSYPGQAYFFKGIGGGMFESFKFIKDKNGKALNPGHSNSCVPFDWDNDGDYDLVWGIRLEEDHIKIAINEGSKTNPVFTEPMAAEVYKTKGFSFGTSATSTYPTDWDGDGLFDLVCGTEFGSVFWIKNTGEIGKPNFTSIPEVLIKIEPKTSTPVKGDPIESHGARVKLFITDYNKDGKKDILLGDIYSEDSTEKPEFSKEKREEFDVVSKKYFAFKKECNEKPVYGKINEITARIHQENPDLTEHEAKGRAFSELSEEDLNTYLSLEEEMDKIWKTEAAPITGADKIESYTHGFVWVYLRK